MLHLAVRQLSHQVLPRWLLRHQQYLPRLTVESRAAVQIADTVEPAKASK